MYIYDSEGTSGIFVKFNGFAFLLPFTNQLWGVIGITVLVFACFLTVVSHLSPYGAHGHFFQSEDAEKCRERHDHRRSSVMSFSSPSAASLHGIGLQRRLSKISPLVNPVKD